MHKNFTSFYNTSLYFKVLRLLGLQFLPFVSGSGKIKDQGLSLFHLAEPALMSSSVC
jgi:hypothetical protein